MFVRISYDIPLHQEEELKNKINDLQLKLLDFNKHINIRKEEASVKEHVKRRRSSDAARASNGFMLSIIGTFITWIGCFACIAWPFFFPTFVYLAEGQTQFFWQVVCVAILTVLFILVKLASDLNDIFRTCVSSIHLYTGDLLSKIDNVQEPIVTFCKSKTSLTLFSALTFCTVYAYTAEQTSGPNLFGASLLCAGFFVGFYVALAARNTKNQGNVALPFIDNHMDNRMHPNTPYSTNSSRDNRLRYRRSPPPSYEESLRENNCDFLKSPITFCNSPYSMAFFK